ncbi:MAG: hypothetical protein IH996_05875 [Proteobacteria bacterium]|nr:hypothetical protein [Pseudomonadota bacterium]
MEIKLKSAFQGIRALNYLIAILAIAVMLELVYDWEKAISPVSSGEGIHGNPAAALNEVDLRYIGPDFRAYLESPVLNRERTPIRILTPGTGNKSGSTVREFELIGILITKEDRWVLFRLPGQAELVRARPGETVSGWTVSGIDPNRVVIERSGRIEELELTGGAE